MTENRIRSFGTVAGITQSPKGLDVGSGNVVATASVQRGVSSMGTSTSLNVAISSVDITKSIVIAHCTSNITTGTPANMMCKVKISDATTVNITRVTGTDVNLAVVWTVIEFSSLKSLQLIEPSVSATTLSNTTISSVNMGKTSLFFTFYTNSSTNNISYLLNKVWLQSSTNVRIERPKSDQAEGYAVYVVEFN